MNMRKVGPCDDGGGDGPDGRALARVTESSAKEAGVMGVVPFEPLHHPNIYFDNSDVIAEDIPTFPGHSVPC